MTTPAQVEAFAVNPEEAIAFFRQKLSLPTQTWTDLWQGMHARAFVVAGATKEDLISDFRNAVDKALAEGKSLEWFRGEFDRIVAAHGWDYKGSRNWRSAVIFNTNLRMAYATGKWAQFKRLADRRPYLRYVAVMDKRTRPLHREWHNVVLPFGHPWWQTHFPPNGWNCRCMVQQLSERDVKRLGLRVWDDPPLSPMVIRTIRTPQGLVSIQVPKGIDPGFAYNPGEAAFGRGAEKMALVRHGKFEPLEEVQRTLSLPALPVDPPVAEIGSRIGRGDEAGIRAALRAALGGDAWIGADPTGSTVNLTQAIADHWLERATRQDGREAYFPFMPEVITRPAEIWVGFARSSDDGEVKLRRRYIKLIRVKKDTVMGVIADADGRQWSGLTFFHGKTKNLARLRVGKLLWRRSGIE